MPKERNCPLCSAGFPLAGKEHVPTQRLGMIPVTRCRKQIQPGDIKAFREFLNRQPGPNHRNGRFRQKNRPYGEYLYYQDRERFLVELCEWLAKNQSLPRNPDIVP
jgi:hypothetical protein